MTNPEIISLVIAWYVIGVCSLLLQIKYEFGRVTVADLLVCLLCGVVGPIGLVFHPPRLKCMKKKLF